MRMKETTEETRCPSCLEELDNLENPKLLPCHHIYCLPCLQYHALRNDSGVKIFCKPCSKTHEIGDLATLATASPYKDRIVERNNTSGVGESDTSSALVDDDRVSCQLSPSQSVRCDKCENTNLSTTAGSAVCYCTDCDRKLCKLHEEKHEDYFAGADKHKLIDIARFILKPTYYMKPKCPDHGYDVGMCCQNCYCLKCPLCEDDKICKGMNKHVFSTLAETGIRIRSEMKHLINPLAEKLEDLSKLEKNTWHILDDVEVECQELSTKVNLKAEELIEEVQRESRKVRNSINNYQILRKKQAEDYLQRVRLHSDDLQKTEVECEMFMRDGHVTELIKERQVKIDDLKAKCEYDPERPDDLSVGSLKAGLQKFLVLEVNLIPEILDYMSSHTTRGSACYSLTHTAHGELIAACQKGLQLYNSDHNAISRGIVYKGEIMSVCATTTENYAIECYGNSECIIKSWNMDERGKFLLLGDISKIEVPYSQVSFVTASDTHVVVAVTLSSALIIYDKLSKVRLTRILSFRPRFVCLTKGRDLLVSGFDEKLYRFKLDEGNELTDIWTCKLADPLGISLYGNNYVIVGSPSTRALYIVALSSGDLVKTLKHKELEGHSAGICVFDERVAVPYGDDNKFKIFNLL